MVLQVSLSLSGKEINDIHKLKEEKLETRGEHSVDEQHD